MRNLVCHKVSEGLAGGLEAAAGRLGLRWRPVDGVDEAVSQAASPDTALVAFGTPADQSGLKELTTAFDLRYVASVMIAADGRWETAAYQAGIGEYIVMPMDQQLLDARLGSIIATRDTLRQARDQMWMAFAYRNAALAESLYVYEIDPVTSKATVLRMSDQAANEYFPLDCYCSGAGSQGYYHPDDWPLIVSTFAPDSLAKEMASGRDDITLSYRIRSRAGRFDWVETKLHFVKDAYGRPSAFSYVKLVDEQRRQQAVLERILHEEIEEIISIDVDDDVFHCIYEAEGAKPGPGCYSLLYADNLKKYATGADVAALVDQLSLAGLQEALVRRPDVSFSYWMQQYDGQRHNNKLTAFYADERHKQIILVTRDVTDLAMEAQKRQQQLEIALTAAQQASAAKTNFLSRMSHEIRTPMNAIIGMNTLAVQALGNDEKVAECLSKIGISVHYLLSLINDILDMSRIESGKMLLRNEQFDFSEFIAGINTMIYNQARIKGLEYECHIAANVAESYIGDAIKLQQTLINVLGNAVKFTAHGCVTMSVEQVSRVGNQDKVRFRVNDTGIGISEADLDKIFEPFEQGDNTTTAVFGGTGLGLAITKSLVDIMGGTIHVRSIVGVGSEFDIELPLTVDEMVVSHAPLAYHFESLHTLIVDDDVITCEQTTEILREIGMQGEWVSSGAEAVERVRKDLEKSRYFDFVLIDWKMPDMDGIETTRRIRKLVGPDVTIIIISAYDWESIEAEARAAGANLFVTKPLFKSTLVSAFQRALGKEEGPAHTKPVFDFSGRRILVAEDNKINAEIAKALLEDKHCQVVIAENGLKAMETFVSHPAHYYDAILMDVRMPQMDGLTATRSIRHWDKPDARSIPIIAMTANAFDEDVDKSKAAGMNAHLSKPIDPEIMYATLSRLISGD